MRGEPVGLKNLIANTWMRVAFNELGVHEIAGREHTERIIFYHSFTTLKATADEIPWCSSFAGYVMATAGYSHPRSARARDWLKWGQVVNYQPGAIAILSRGSNPAQGHVGFVVSMTDKTINLLGGNQGDAVTVRPYHRSRLLGLRWPNPDELKARLNTL